MFFCRKKQIVNKDKIVFLSKQFILCLFQFENCVFRSESVAKSDKLSYNEKRKRGIFLLLFWRRSSKVRIGVYFMKEKEKTKVVLADRDGFYLQRLKRCLERRGDMTVVGMADNGVALLDLVIQKKPAVLLTDILLGERDAYGFWKTSKRGDFRVSAFLFPRLTAISWCGRQSALVRSIIWRSRFRGSFCWSASIRC